MEVAGFTGTAGTIGPEFDQFDDGRGSPVPLPDASGIRNEPIRQTVLARLNATPNYRALFGARFPAVAAGGAIDFTMFRTGDRRVRVLADLRRCAHRPVRAREPAGDDRAAEGGRARVLREGCSTCHAVAGGANEMFSDFDMHVIGVPQIAPVFGAGTSNMLYDGPGRDEDFGLEQVTGNPGDRYKFRSSPLRNVALQPAFFHNGAFTRLEDAIAHHLNVAASARTYSPTRAGVARDLPSGWGRSSRCSSGSIRP